MHTTLQDENEHCHGYQKMPAVQSFSLCSFTVNALKSLSAYLLWTRGSSTNIDLKHCNGPNLI